MTRRVIAIHAGSCLALSLSSKSRSGTDVKRLASEPLPALAVTCMWYSCPSLVAPRTSKAAISRSVGLGGSPGMADRRGRAENLLLPVDHEFDFSHTVARRYEAYDLCPSQQHQMPPRINVVSPPPPDVFPDGIEQ